MDTGTDMDAGIILYQNTLKNYENRIQARVYTYTLVANRVQDEL